MNSTEIIKSADTIRKEVLINAPLSKVWQALTEKAHLEKWFMKSDDYKPEEGNTFHMKGTDDDCNHLHTCRIIEIIYGKKFSYTWNVEGMAGDTLVTYELEEENGNTKLTLTHSGWDKVTIHNPALSRNEHDKGWEAILNTVLKQYIEKI